MIYTVPIELKETEHGRSVFIREPVSAGSVVMREPSCFAWSLRRYRRSTCAACMRYSHGAVFQLSCKGCGQMYYCNEECAARHQKYHNAVCRSYAMLNSFSDELDDEAEAIVKLVFEVACLYLSDSEKYQRFMDQTRGGVSLTADEERSCKIALDILVATIPTSDFLELTINWIKDVVLRDKSNGQAIMLPYVARPDDENEDSNSGEVVRGYASQPLLGLVNHSCIPNCSRWDNADVVSGPASDHCDDSSLCMCYRALYDLPAGSEITISYAPLLWGYDDRQDYCTEMFGFTCTCKRCEVESQYPSDDSEAEYESSEEHEGISSTMAPSDAYISLFILRHACTEFNCTGTLTPCVNFQAESTDHDIYECSVCPYVRRNAEFIDMLSSGM